MTRRRLIFAGAFLLAMVLAFLLRDVVERTIMAPLAYLWWVAKLYYLSLPQYILWIALIVVSVLWAASSLLPEGSVGGGPKPNSIMIQGQIADLADWLDKSRRGGTYYKWLIANRLAKDAREILAQLDGHAVSKKFGRLHGRGWQPPAEIESYLESGLNGSFADYPQLRFWKTPHPTPLDQDPQRVIDYLENEMETGHDSDSKGI